MQQKWGRTSHQQWVDGKRKSHFTGKKRPDVVERMLSDQNPMKDLSKRKSILQKIVKSWISNGRVSKGELMVKEALEFIGVDFVHQHVVPGPSRVYSLDFFLPNEKICVEYDGHSGHYTEKGILKSKKRDEYLFEQYGITTIRICRDEAFIGVRNLTNLLLDRVEQ